MHHAASTRARPRREESGLRRGPRGGTCRERSRIVDVSRRARARGVASSFRVLTRISARGPGREAWREGLLRLGAYPSRATTAATVRRRRVSCILARL